jgi:2-polyprenyl-3-methyl-5-hydroxy-6-metoxy-1,4-benzoquinol methylase
LTPPTSDACPACLAIRAARWARKQGCELWKCGGCGAIYARAEAVEAETAALYATYYDRPRTELAPVVEAALARVVRGAAAFRQTGRWLDMGYGEGSLLAVAAADGWQCHGTEVGENVLEEGRSRGWTVARDTADTARFAPGGFDVVTLIETLEHVPGPRGFLADAARLLRPGGLLFLTTPNADSLNRRFLGASWSVISPPEHLTLWTARGLRAAASSLGFRVDRLRTEGLNPVEILARARPSPGGAPVHRNEAALALNTAFSRSRWRRACKAAVNSGLSLLRVGDTLKLWARRTGE